MICTATDHDITTASMLPPQHGALLSKLNYDGKIFILELPSTTG